MALRIILVYGVEMAGVWWELKCHARLLTVDMMWLCRFELTYLSRQSLWEGVPAVGQLAIRGVGSFTCTWCPSTMHVGLRLLACFFDRLLDRLLASLTASLVASLAASLTVCVLAWLLA